jgi:hypothetical protein
MHLSLQLHALPPRIEFLKRVARSASIASGLVLGSLGLGAIGYHVFEDLPWLDSTLNAVMILTGMGPVDPLRTTAGKLFGIFYALFSGVAFLTMVAVLFAPVAHRFLHRFHLDIARDPDAERS